MFLEVEQTSEIIYFYLLSVRKCGVCWQKMAAYNEQYQKYLESLPEDERVALGGTTIKKAESPPASPEKKNSAKPQVCLGDVYIC